MKKNTIEIDGNTWHTKKSLCQIMRIKKSLFYEMVNDGRIESRQLFDDSYFRVYKLQQPTND